MSHRARIKRFKLRASGKRRVGVWLKGRIIKRAGEGQTKGVRKREGRSTGTLGGKEQIKIFLQVFVGGWGEIDLGEKDGRLLRVKKKKARERGSLGGGTF